MGNKDIISKQVLSHLAADIANLLLHLDVDMNSVELLETEHQRVELRRADMVARMRKRSSQEAFILHVEIQNANHAQMASRMLRYFTDIHLQYSDEPIHQHLVYIGKQSFNMPLEIQQPAFTYRYSLLDMRTVDCSLLLAQDTPDALVLAILCDFKQRPTQEVVNYIVMRLKQLTADDEGRFRNYFEMLETLADNRDLQPQLDEAKQMLTQVNIKKFASYNWGYQDGKAEGREEGREEGLELGELLGEKRRAQTIAQKMLQRQKYSIEEIAEISGLSVEEVTELQNTQPKPH